MSSNGNHKISLKKRELVVLAPDSSPSQMKPDSSNFLLEGQEENKLKNKSYHESRTTFNEFHAGYNENSSNSGLLYQQNKGSGSPSNKVSENIAINSSKSTLEKIKPRLSYFASNNPSIKIVPIFIPPKSEIKSLKPIAISPDESPNPVVSSRTFSKSVKLFSDLSDDEPPLQKKRKLIRKADVPKEEPIIIDLDPPVAKTSTVSYHTISIPESPVVPVAQIDNVEYLDSEELEEVAVDQEIQEWLNSAEEADLIETLQCSSENAHFIITSRPIPDYREWEKISSTSQGLQKCLRRYRVILQDLGSVDGIVKHCHFVGNEISKIVESWELSRTSGVVMKSKYEFLAAQPDIINPKLQLKQYQLLGVSWMLMLYDKSLSGILADEMGLGKTAQSICFIGCLYARGNNGPHLIIVPSSTLDNWKREIDFWCPTLKAVLYSGSQAERYSLQHEISESDDINIVVTTYTIATGASDDRKFLRSRSFKTLFLDEGHMIKNGDSQRAKHLKNLKIPFKMLITGTPMQNNLMELLSLLTFIMPSLFLPVYDALAAIFSIKQTNNKLEDGISKKRIQHAAKIMHPFVLRRKKDDANDIPPKIREVIYCPMSAKQKLMYHQIMLNSKKEYIQTKHEVGKKKITKKALASTSNALRNVLMALRKAANHQLLHRQHYTDQMLPEMAKDIMKELEFMDSNRDYVVEDMSVMSDFQLHTLLKQYPKVQKYQLTENDWMDSGKVKVLSERLPKMIKAGDKILIFSQFVIMLDILETVLACLNIEFLRLDGSTPGNERLALIDLFNNSNNISVFLLSTKACGLGINLTSANVVILYDIDFNPHNDAQAEDRAHRVGQKRTVKIYKLIAEGSVEQHMLKCANFKLLLDTKVSEDMSRSALGLEAIESEMGSEKEDPEEKLLDMIRNDILKENDD